MMQHCKVLLQQIWHKHKQARVLVSQASAKFERSYSIALPANTSGLTYDGWLGPSAATGLLVNT